MREDDFEDLEAAMAMIAPFLGIGIAAILIHIGVF